jgi:hypothetical protein
MEPIRKMGKPGITTYYTYHIKQINQFVMVEIMSYQLQIFNVGDLLSKQMSSYVHTQGNLYPLSTQFDIVNDKAIIHATGQSSFIFQIDI